MMKNEKVKPYYDYLNNHRLSLFFKRLFDIIIAIICIIIATPLIYIPCIILIKLTSKGPVFYKQIRIGRYCEDFKIFKFRTMVVNADKIGSALTVGQDVRITPIGKFLRATRFDELPQFFNVLFGQMSVIGTRPDVPYYLKYYTDEMLACMLLTPGQTGRASIIYRHESAVLAKAEDPEKEYIEKIIPAKMNINLDYTREFSFVHDIYLIYRTFKCLFEKDELVDEA